MNTGQERAEDEVENETASAGSCFLVEINQPEFCIYRCLY